MTGRKWLISGGLLSAAASLIHVATIFGGGDWYRFLGAGEEMARAAERGSAMPAVVTAAIALILLAWALYAFSGAGLIRRLPLLRTGLVVISAIYLLRGLALLPLLVLRPRAINSFAIVSSTIVLVYGLVYALGTWREWPRLSAPRDSSLSARSPTG